MDDFDGFGTCGLSCAGEAGGNKSSVSVARPWLLACCLGCLNLAGGLRGVYEGCCGTNSVSPDDEEDEDEDEDGGARDPPRR